MKSRNQRAIIQGSENAGLLRHRVATSLWQPLTSGTHHASSTMAASNSRTSFFSRSPMGITKQNGHSNSYSHSFVGQTPVLIKAMQPSSSPYGSLKTWVQFVAGTSALAYLFCSDHIKQPTVDKSVLKNDEFKHNANLSVIDALRLSSASDQFEIGHSHVHKVKFNNNSKEEYYYHKETFTRNTLLNELVFGKLLFKLIGNDFPNVYAVETPLNDVKDNSKYSVISQSVGTSNMNLQDWAYQYSSSEDRSTLPLPRHLGLAIATEKLLGKFDCKLQNLVMVNDGNAHSYSIDHESMLAKAPTILTNAKEGLRYIGEFSQKDTAFENAADSIGGGADGNENPYQPIKNEGDIKKLIKPILQQAINEDLENGVVMAFYQKFADFTEEELNQIYDSFGSLMTGEERKQYTDNIKQRQQFVREYLATCQNEKENEETHSSSFRLRN